MKIKWKQMQASRNTNFDLANVRAHQGMMFGESESPTVERRQYLEHIKEGFYQSLKYATWMHLASDIKLKD